MIALTLTRTEARALHKLLAREGAGKVLTAIEEQLAREIELDAPVSVAPWRKVVGKDRRGLYWSELLECGHRYQLRTTKRWQESNADKRRCKQCPAEATA